MCSGIVYTMYNNSQSLEGMSKFIKNAAIELAKAKDLAGVGLYLADETDKIVTQHALIAVGSAWIPLPGADIAAMTANVWTMYVRINKKFYIKFSDNAMKSIGSAIIGNLSANLVALGVGSLLKFIPGISLISGALMSAVVYATTLTAAWVYIRALAKFITHGGGNESVLRMCVNDVLDDAETLKAVFNDAKSNYKK